MARKYELNTPEDTPKRRVSLSKKAASTEEGRQLLSILTSITSDGELSAEEIQSLYGWLNTIEVDFPALNFLRSEIEAAAEDGRLTPEETLDIYLAIEKVLPASDRAKARERRYAAQGIDINRPAWEDDPITEKQADFLVSLGGNPEKFRSKGEASAEIDRLLNGQSSVSNRQMMVLRFWGMTEIAKGGKSGVIEYLDGFYAEDGDRMAAWNLWKEENGDVGRQDDSKRVPLGVGPRYLKRVKAGGRGNGCLSKLLLLLIGLVVVAIVLPKMISSQSRSGEQASPAPVNGEPLPSNESPPTLAPTPRPISVGDKARLRKELAIALPHGIARCKEGTEITIKALRGDEVIFEAYGQTNSVPVRDIALIGR